jgi:hypothetical protein
MKLQALIDFLETLPPMTHVCHREGEFGGPGDSFMLHDLQYMPIEGTLLICAPVAEEDEE